MKSKLKVIGLDCQVGKTMVRIPRRVNNLLEVGALAGQEIGDTGEFRREDSWIAGHLITSRIQGIRYFSDVSTISTSHIPRTAFAR